MNLGRYRCPRPECRVIHYSARALCSGGWPIYDPARPGARVPEHPRERVVPDSQFPPEAPPPVAWSPGPVVPPAAPGAPGLPHRLELWRVDPAGTMPLVALLEPPGIGLYWRPDPTRGLPENWPHGYEWRRFTADGAEVARYPASP